MIETDTSNVLKMYIPRTAAKRLADEEASDVDEPSSLMVTMPALTFSKSTSAGHELSKSMNRWLKQALGV